MCVNYKIYNTKHLKSMNKLVEQLLKTTPKVMITVAGTIGAAYIADKAVNTVPSSHIAHTNFFGNISTHKLEAGLHVINPLSTLVVLPLLTNNFATSIDVATNEGLTLSVQINTIYKLDEDNARNVYLKFRYEYEDILIKPLIESTLRNIMSCYEAKALYSDKTREEIKKRINTEVKNSLISEGIIVNDVLINKIILPSQLQLSIENKLRVEQENAQMLFTIEKKRQEIAFELEKEKMESERKKIEAEGIRQFQEITSKGITPDMLKWKALAATEKIAESANAKVIIIGNKDTNGMPIIIGDK